MLTAMLYYLAVTFPLTVSRCSFWLSIPSAICQQDIEVGSFSTTVVTMAAFTLIRWRMTKTRSEEDPPRQMLGQDGPEEPLAAWRHHILRSTLSCFIGCLCHILSEIYCIFMHGQGSFFTVVDVLVLMFVEQFIAQVVLLAFLYHLVLPGCGVSDWPDTLMTCCRRSGQEPHTMIQIGINWMNREYHE